MKRGRAAARTACVIALVSAVALYFGGCAAGPPEPGKPADPRAAIGIEKVGGISVSLRSDPAVTPRGGTFSITLTVRNLSGKKVEYTSPSGQTYEFLAFDKGGQEVWRWSKGMMFIQVVSAVILEPGASKTFKVAWDSAAAPGLYTIQGYLLGLGNVRPSVSVEITGG